MDTMMRKIQNTLDLKKLITILKDDRSSLPKWSNYPNKFNEKVLIEELQIQFGLKKISGLQIKEFFWETLSKNFLEFGDDEEQVQLRYVTSPDGLEELIQ